MQGLEMKYFVLKPKGSDEYALASRGAMRKYASLIHRTNPELASGLTAWAEQEYKNSFDEDETEENL
jgi:hypothetical protein